MNRNAVGCGWVSVPLLILVSFILLYIGSTNQHAHCNQGRADVWEGHALFPFVCIHGFGKWDFEMWLLPQGKKYGFRHVVRKDCMLLMRGDFTHAGGLQQEDGHRCHMAFFPTIRAGWRDSTAYWLSGDFRNPDLTDTVQTSFVCQKHTYPFAFPVASTACEGIESDERLITYPTDMTDMLYSDNEIIRKAAHDMIRDTSDGLFY
jgi:hypothetical protein